jgi:hypothetical protein
VSKTIKFKDTVVAHGSKLYAALEDKDLKLAEKLYKECEVEYRKYRVKKVWTVEDQEALLVEQNRLQKLMFSNAITNYERVKLEIVRSGLTSIEELVNGKVSEVGEGKTPGTAVHPS